jgi:hypothetical protein
MRSITIKGGIPTFIAQHESDFIDENFEHGDVIYKSELNEREAEIARVLTSRGVLQRFSDGDKGIYYSKNINTGVE